MFQFLEVLCNMNSEVRKNLEVSPFAGSSVVQCAECLRVTNPFPKWLPLLQAWSLQYCTCMVYSLYIVETKSVLDAVGRVVIIFTISNIFEK